MLLGALCRTPPQVQVVSGAQGHARPTLGVGLLGSLGLLIHMSQMGTPDCPWPGRCQVHVWGHSLFCCGQHEK